VSTKRNYHDLYRTGRKAERLPSFSVLYTRKTKDAGCSVCGLLLLETVFNPFISSIKICIPRFDASFLAP
jgi:hypothetical protein